jgi:hypothetical protein
MDEKAIRRAALVTVRRAILERFPPGPERETWLRWAEQIAFCNDAHSPALFGA